MTRELQEEAIAFLSSDDAPKDDEEALREAIARIVQIINETSFTPNFK